MMPSFVPMGDSETWWVTAANLALGALVLAGVLAAAIDLLRYLISRRRQRTALSRELDRDLKRLLAELESFRPDYNEQNGSRPPR
jgi:hypothetical protein